ncbi:uncharacterized protein EAE98_007050 [Botrytis deweyae]|uniref:Uncharacterized protein n=1 Tax=Botrytis deweyae TaxID=2478750 RepID=A0ABQ7IHX5_9HELO|nr:uncharacterized protein EAE98_007050 [Botrytis deweyae]KAF7924962.1 hypothetical protein EAE98_007050 [Botrytis deweyae]
MADIELKKMASCDNSDQERKDLLEVENTPRTLMAGVVDKSTGSSLPLASPLISSEYDVPNIHTEDKGKSPCFQKAQTVIDEDESLEIKSTGNYEEKFHMDHERIDSDILPQNNTTTAQSYGLATDTLEAASQGQDETSVTVPIAKLPQLVKYGIQVLQESRKKIKSAQIDPERNSTEVVHDNSQLSNMAVETVFVAMMKRNMVRLNMSS